MTDPHERLRYHVTGAIERGEADAITEERCSGKTWICPRCSRAYSNQDHCTSSDCPSNREYENDV